MLEEDSVELRAFILLCPTRNKRTVYTGTGKDRDKYLNSAGVSGKTWTYWRKELQKLSYIDISYFPEITRIPRNNRYE